MRNLFLSLRKDEKGASLVDWTIIASLIAAVAVGVMVTFGGAMETALSELETCITTVTTDSTACGTNPGATP